MIDTDTEEEDMPILLPLGRQGADTPNDATTEILCGYAVDRDPDVFITALQNTGEEQATLSAVGVARTPEEALDLVHKARTGHRGARET